MNKKDLIFLHSGWLSTIDPADLKHHFGLLLQVCGFEILHFVEHHFSPHGYTCVWLLGESHCAIHTFPEKNTTFFELCSCNEEKLLHFQNEIKARFQ
jgi:S-adenosylmethionine decarboxylase